MDQKIFALYSAPFKQTYGYIFDAKGEMVAWMWPRPWEKGVEPSRFQARGWGRIKYLDDAENLFTLLEATLLDIVKQCDTDIDQCVKALDDAWQISSKSNS